MPIPPPSSPLPNTWTVPPAHIPGHIPRDATPAPYTELAPELEHRSRVAQNYFNQMDRYAEDTHPDSARQLEAQRPQSLPPTYWQAMGQASPLPEHVEDGELPPTYDRAVGADHPTGQDALMFDPSLSGRARAQALKHVQRLDDLLDKAEQLGALLLGRNEQGETSIDVNTVASLCKKIDRLRSSWASGVFADSSRVLGQLANTCIPIYRAERETALKTSIEKLWDVAKTEYREKYLPDPVTADPILPKVYLMVEGLKKAEI
ncbi:hypothetical protein SAMN04490186_0408 [Pseudomonas grimontii]|uniref:Uncharacterized protein n=1 Tax=Pseudomonas grimontii TaxID=129847 RepID=A0A1H1AQR9_9PSED|nr:hypothetical protein [Pseudomonas grimontii]TWR65456.1 hypothetical protein FIV39_16310 [Pseudomonas grimontii]SDQ41526.1 hypothetical protein SAMN04490186_0408 [Pseudomonas grimontii]